MRILDQLQQKIKDTESKKWFDSLMWFFIMFFICISAFSLGMMYERSLIRDQNPITVEYNETALQLWNEYQNAKYDNVQYFASKSGLIVYPVGCTKGDRVKKENRIFFTEINQALELGYRLVDGC